MSVENKAPFSLPLKLADEYLYDKQYVVCDSNWRCVARFPKNEKGKAKADFLVDAVNAYGKVRGFL